MFDVEDEYAESDIPTTLIRSKADCPGIEVSHLLINGLALCSCGCCTKKAFVSLDRMWAIILEINYNQLFRCNFYDIL